MVFKRNNSITSDCTRILEQVCHFNYDYVKDIDNRTAKYQMTCGTIRRTLNKDQFKNTTEMLYKVPPFLCG